MFSTLAGRVANARAARRWVLDALGPGAVAAHFIAISADGARAAEFGIDEAHTLPMWDWVGGRYSVWSAIGLSCAIAVGWFGLGSYVLCWALDLEVSGRSLRVTHECTIMYTLTHAHTSLSLSLTHALTQTR